MEITVTGKNLEVPEPIRKYVTRKLERLLRRFNNLVQEAQVTVSAQRNWQTVEITLSAVGNLLRAEERTNDWRASCDSALDKLERQLLKHKERLIQRHRAQVEVPSPGEEEPAAESALPRIVRTKTFSLRPTTIEEAVLQMDLLGHDFYVFNNAETGEINVLYRRKDGDLGLLQPEP
ncbi:MAG TPA: ribosome-associated translation inhibitor RaiA [Armatimonadetes bacterium]|nr:ribosome-associated translation inhibitor RaiA [Armatimonadota bacterium]